MSETGPVQVTGTTYTEINTQPPVFEEEQNKTLDTTMPPAEIGEEKPLLEVEEVRTDVVVQSDLVEEDATLSVIPVQVDQKTADDTDDITEPVESEHMKEVKTSLAEFKRLRELYEGETDLTLKRGYRDDLRRVSQELITSCRWYSSFRHPITKEDKARKKVIEDISESTQKSLKKLEKESLRDSTSIDASESESGYKKIEVMGKKEHIMDSDFARLEKKKQLTDSATDDLLKRDITEKQKELLSLIRQYGEIHTTPMHVAGAMKNILGPGRHNPFKLLGAMCKIFKKRYRVNKENEIILNIKSMMEEMGDDAYAQKYGDIFSEIYSGKLDISGVPANDILDFTTRDKLTESQFKDDKVTKKNLDTVDMKKNVLFPHDPSTADISQGDFGDCYFLACLAEVAAKDGNAIKNMMKDEGDNVVVRFFHKDTTGTISPVYIRVSKVVAKNGSGDALWVKLMEKAYAAYLQQFQDDTNFQTSQYYKLKEKGPGWIKANEIDYSFMSNGGQMTDSFVHITGHDRLNVKRIAFNKRESRIDNPGDMITHVFNNSEGKAVMEKLEEERMDLAEAKLYAQESEKADEIMGARFNQKFCVFDDNGITVLMIKEITDETEALRRARIDRLRAELPEQIRQKNIMRDQLRKLTEERDKFDKDDPRYDELEKRRSEFEKEYVAHPAIKNQSAIKMYDMEQDDNYDISQRVMTKTARVSMLANMSDQLIKIYAKKAGVTIRNTPDAKEDYQKLLDELNKDYDKDELYKEVEIMAISTAITVGIESDDLIRLTMKQARMEIQMIVDNFTDITSQQVNVPFSGVYSDTALKIYDYIEQNSDKYLGASSRRFKEGKKSEGHHGEKLLGGITGGHAYSILGVTTKNFGGKQIRFVKLRNPWATCIPDYKINEKTGEVEAFENFERTNGTFLCELTHFIQKYEAVHTGAV